MSFAEFWSIARGLLLLFIVVDWGYLRYENYKRKTAEKVQRINEEREAEAQAKAELEEYRLREKYSHMDAPPPIE